jgi:CRISPR-associated protein Csy2
MSTQTQFFEPALITLPWIRVQNANCISSPLTWGFPCITAFGGLTTAIERKLENDSGVKFISFGVVCHSFEPQVTKSKYKTTFNLTRNPVDDKGATSAIVEEGRAHMTISLLLEIAFDSEKYFESDDRDQLVRKVWATLQTMRIAGGSIVPDSTPRRQSQMPTLIRFDDDWALRWKRLRVNLLPGFALVSRSDLLTNHLKAMRKDNIATSQLDAWLDLSRFNQRAFRVPAPDENNKLKEEGVEWRIDDRPGWLVPISVGYAAISKLYAPGAVANARDKSASFSFVESIYSIGQWVSPHRAATHEKLMWKALPPDSKGIYQCVNAYAQ